MKSINMRRVNHIAPIWLATIWIAGLSSAVALVGVLARLTVPSRHPFPAQYLVLDRLEQDPADSGGTPVGGIGWSVIGVGADGDVQPLQASNPVPLTPGTIESGAELNAPLPIAVLERPDPHTPQFASALFTGAQTSAPTPQVQQPVNIGSRETPELCAYIPVTSGLGWGGYHPQFAELGGWNRGPTAFFPEVEKRLRDGKFKRALVWRPHGMRPNGDMPLDAMLYQRPDSLNAIEREAADERAFVAGLKSCKSALGAGGQLWVYIGNLEEAGVGERRLQDIPKAERDERIKRVLHPLRSAGVDGVVIDASGPAVKGSAYEDAAKLVLDYGFEFVGVEGWPELRKSEHWAADPRVTAFTLPQMYTIRDGYYPPPSRTRGQLAVINAAKLGAYKQVARTKDEMIAFIADAKANNIWPYIDIYTLTDWQITPAKGY